MLSAIFRTGRHGCVGIGLSTADHPPPYPGERHSPQGCCGIRLRMTHDSSTIPLNTIIMIIQNLLNIGARTLHTAVRQRCARMRKRAIIAAGHIFGGAVCLAVSMSIVLMAVVFASIGLLVWLETIMASQWAYLSVAGVYVLLYVMVRALRHRLFYRPIIRYIFRVLGTEDD